jgi:uncharacterized protein Usg
VRSDLVTANILYHMPDRLWLLQTFVWQEYDEPPRLPRLHDFITFWRREIDGPLHSVTVTWSRGEHGFYFADHVSTLH